MKTWCMFSYALLIFCSAAKAQFSVTAINAGCYHFCNGIARVTPDSNYRFHWSNGDTIAVAENLCAGTYTCTISDTLGIALDTVSAVITEPAQITAAISTDSAACPGAHNGVISITMSGGIPPYYYCVTKADSGLVFRPTGTFTGLDTGWYHIILADVNECGRTDSAFVGWSSNICTGINHIPELLNFSLQPNPVSHLTQLAYELEIPLQLNISVYDLTGKKVQQILNQTEAKGPHIHPIDLATLASGQYILNVVSNRGSYTLPFVKQ